MIRSLILILCMMAATATAQQHPYLLVGTYTSGKSEGIYVYDFDPATADTRLISTAKASNPSYLAVAPDQRTVFAVNEDADTNKAGIGGGVSAFRMDKAGQLRFINKQFSGGKHPCYVAVDGSGKWVFCGNYSSGNLAVFGVNKTTGRLTPSVQRIQHTGAGRDKQRQEGPHVHCTMLSPDEKYLLVADLGLDKIMSYRFNKTTGKLTKATPPFVSTTPASGPRHIAFHPKGTTAYVIEEMTGQVQAFSYNNGELTPTQRIASLPEGFTGDIGAADIHVSPNGKFLYCSNRGAANCITWFTIKEDGTLTWAGLQPTLGIAPRNFNFDPSGNFLLVGNQQSDEVVIFTVDKNTGALKDSGKRISVPAPVCIKWITPPVTKK